MLRILVIAGLLYVAYLFAGATISAAKVTLSSTFAWMYEDY